MRDFTLGTMYWLNPNHGPEEFDEDMRRIKADNFLLIRVFVTWEYIENIEGEYDFSGMDMLFEAADKHGLKVMATIGFYPPFWLTRQLDQSGKNDPGRYPCLERPEVTEPLLRYVQHVVTRYRNASALAYWNLWNEPTANDTPCQPVLEKFVAWLKSRYSTIQELQDAWNGEHSIFKLVCPESLEALTVDWVRDVFRLADRGRCAPVQYDYHRFTMWNLTEQVTMLSKAVKALDPVHPTHTNLHSMASNPVAIGQDRFRLSEAVDTISCSIHASNDYRPGEQVCDRAGNFAFGVDQTFSWTKGARPTWVGELQAGTTACHWNKYTPSAKTVAYELWRTLAGGLDGVVFWQWQGWRGGLFELGEFSLRNASDGGSTDRSEAVKEFGRLYQENKTLFGEVERPASQVALLYSHDTCIGKLMQGCERPMLAGYANDAIYALFGCYRALSQANIAVEFISEERVEQGGLNRYQVLYMPGVETMRAGTAAKIKDFVSAGGAVYADGRCAFLDEHLYLRDRIPGHALAEVFGACEADFVAASDAEITSDDGRTLHAHIFSQYLKPLGDGRVTARFPGGRPAVVDNCHGKGRTRLVGTGLCRSLRERDDIDTIDFIVDFALTSGVSPELSITPGFSGKRLIGSERDILIVTNHGTETAEAVILVECRTIKCLQGEADFDKRAIHRVFSPEETAVFILSK
jgi:beta-galactosidase